MQEVKNTHIPSNKTFPGRLPATRRPLPLSCCVRFEPLLCKADRLVCPAALPSPITGTSIMAGNRKFLVCYKCLLAWSALLGACLRSCNASLRVAREKPSQRILEASGWLHDEKETTALHSGDCSYTHLPSATTCTIWQCGAASSAGLVHPLRKLKI